MRFVIVIQPGLRRLWQCIDKVASLPIHVFINLCWFGLRRVAMYKQRRYCKCQANDGTNNSNYRYASSFYKQTNGSSHCSDAQCYSLRKKSFVVRAQLICGLIESMISNVCFWYIAGLPTLKPRFSMTRHVRSVAQVKTRNQLGMNESFCRRNRAMMNFFAKYICEELVFCSQFKAKIRV